MAFFDREVNEKKGCTRKNRRVGNIENPIRARPEKKMYHIHHMSAVQNVEHVAKSAGKNEGQRHLLHSRVRLEENIRQIRHDSNAENQKLGCEGSKHAPRCAAI